MTARRVRDIEYQLLPGTDRNTTDIVIERNGAIAVRPPAGYTAEQVDAVVDSKRMWIYRNLAEWKDLNASTVTREWVNGETFLYLGRAYRLSLVSGQGCALQLKEGRFCLSRSVIEEGGVQAARQAFMSYYTAKCMQRFSHRVAYFAPKVGVKVAAIKVKNMSYRWASCGKNGGLNIHWKCMMAPQKSSTILWCMSCVIFINVITPMLFGMRLIRSFQIIETGRNGCVGTGLVWIFDAYLIVAYTHHVKVLGFKCASYSFRGKAQ